MLYNILLIDSNPIVFDLVQGEWKKYGGCLTNVQTTQEATAELRVKEHHLITIVKDYVGDLLLSTVKTMHDAYELPILVLTSHYDGVEKVAALRNGADEYLLIPETFEEGIMTGIALIRRYRNTRSRNQNESKLSFQEISLDRQKKQVTVAGKPIELTRGEYACLELLLSQPARVFTYEMIYFHTYGDEAPAENVTGAVRNLINRIRKKLGSDYLKYIRTFQGVGYKLDYPTVL